MSVHAPSGRTLLLGGAVAVGATAASAALRRTRAEEPTPVPYTPFEPRAVVTAVPAMRMSPDGLDAALASAFPGDETPGYL